MANPTFPSLSPSPHLFQLNFDKHWMDIFVQFMTNDFNKKIGIKNKIIQIFNDLSLFLQI